MATIQIGDGEGLLTKASPYTKYLRARFMYDRAKGFIAASILLGQKGQFEHVVLHLLCQALEIFLKSILLMKDYDFYQPRLPKKPYGHNLVRLSEEVLAVLDLNKLKPDVAKELRALNELYGLHWLRYSSVYDILVAPETIPRDRIRRRLAAGIRLAQRRPPFK
jgi:hypothetical protein